MLPEFDLVNEIDKQSETLIIIPVFNEYPMIKKILEEVQKCSCCHTGDVLVIDDCSSDGGSEFLDNCKNIFVIRNRKNAGAGGVLLRGFEFAKEKEYKYVITMDSDGQHNACQIHEFLFKIKESGADIVSGTRYPAGFTKLCEAFQHRQDVNRELTEYINQKTGLRLTESFCGFKAYKVDALRRIDIENVGYGMLLELTVKAALLGIKIIEHPVPLIYLDETRDFNNQFSDYKVRLKYYYSVINKALSKE